MIDRINFLILSSVVAAVLGSSTTAKGQGEPVGTLTTPDGRSLTMLKFHHSDYAFNLLPNWAVQEELKLTDGQKEKIQKAKASLDKKKAQLPDGRSLEARKEQEDLEREIDNTYKKILTKSQYVRLDQIELQRQGPLAILYGGRKMIEKLEMTEEQVEAMEKLEASLTADRRRIYEQSRNELKEIPETPAGKEKKTELIDQRWKKVEALSDKNAKALLGILSHAQRKTFEKMIGKPFDVSKLKAGTGQAQTKAS